MATQFCTCSPVVICCSTGSPTTLTPSMFTVAFQGYLGATLSVIHQFGGGSSQGISWGTLSVGTIACTAGSGNNPDATANLIADTFSPAVVYHPAAGFASNGDAFLWSATDSAGKNVTGGGQSDVALLPPTFSYAIPLASNVLSGVTYADGTVTGTYTSTFPPTTVVLSGNNYGDTNNTYAGTYVAPTVWLQPKE